MSLHVDLLGPTDGPLVLLAHGILGMGRNWRSMARRMTQLFPGWRVALVDLRHHGRSQGFAQPNDVAACARDLAALDLGPVSVAIGHSFGGKVVLEWLRQGAELDQVWSLDSPPGSRPVDPLVIDTLGVLTAVRATPVPSESRDAIREHLRAAGLGDTLIAWLLTSTHRTDAGWDWVWDLDAVDQMITDYLQLDLVPWLRQWEGTPIELVRAERSDRWTPDEIALFEGPDAPASVHLHTLSNAGHWVHVDNPLGLLQLFETHWHSARLRQPLGGHP